MTLVAETLINTTQKERILTLPEAILDASFRLKTDMEAGMQKLSRDEYLSRLGNLCLDSGSAIDDLPDSISFAWNYARSLRNDDFLIAKGLEHLLDQVLVTTDSQQI